MPVYDTPINTDDTNLKKVIQAGLPVVLYLHDKANAAVDEALNRVAKEHVGKLFVARVNATANPQTYADYGRPALPALITLEKGSVKSKAAPVQSSMVQEHVRYLLGQGPMPKQAETRTRTTDSTASAATIKTTDATFSADVLQSSVPVVVDFWAPWCGPCHMVAPALEQLAQQYAGQVKIAKLNVDENPRMARQYQAMSIPLLLLFKNGQVVGRLVGAHPKSKIEQMIRQAL